MGSPCTTLINTALRRRKFEILLLQAEPSSKIDYFVQGSKLRISGSYQDDSRSLGVTMKRFLKCLSVTHCGLGGRCTNSFYIAPEKDKY
uniref:CUB domain-containing protein n=1 Tax=Steinernema glaseri TaxID=37863 RepID=A0A1I7Y536_9BILA